MTARNDWVEIIAKMKRYQDKGRRAPHKPLLLLLALGKLQQNPTARWLPYLVVEPQLTELLNDFGPPTKPTPRNPFERLEEALWTLTPSVTPDSTSLEQLRENVSGKLSDAFTTDLVDDPTLLAQVVRYLLDANFPESLHAAILAQVGLDFALPETYAPTPKHLPMKRRDPKFREQVLIAYEYTCAMCGWDGRLGQDTVGLDAAHVRWWALDGPDHLNNGIGLCTMHHTLFDRGAIGIAHDRSILVSRTFIGKGDAANQLVLKLQGEQLRTPQPGLDGPADAYLEWHHEQVFRQPHRGAV